MTEFKVEQSGWYRTREGRDAEIIINLGTNSPQPVVGYVVGVPYTKKTWCLDGKYYSSGQSIDDLVEYLGKERPKRKKVVRMAPALICNYKEEYLITSRIYSEEQAIKELGHGLVRWLIDTPYAIEVEVEG